MRDCIQITLATRNRHKTAEIQAILGSTVRCRSLADFPEAPELIEDADSFTGNATRKARQLADWLAGRPDAGPCWVMADDSGLEVDALHGEPGVRSARYASADAGTDGNAPDRANNEKLLRGLEGIPPERRTARFRCVLALIEISETGTVDPTPRVFSGVCEGEIGSAPRGTQGFGYDPLFRPAGHTRTFAEMDDAAKNAISHRRAALDALRRWLESASPGR